jgi:hypothetical protein
MKMNDEVTRLNRDTRKAPCGCRVTTYSDQPSGIIYCSAHKAAPRMLEALRVIEGAEVDDYGDRIITPSEMTIIRAAIAEAE